MSRLLAMFGLVVVLPGCSPASISVQRGSEEVSIQRGNVSLSGTLELPDANGPVPAVLLVQGSAAVDRSNGGLFDTLALRLAEAGVASLRFDDRGVGGSGGVKYDLSADSLVGDVIALHAYLRDRPETDARRVGLLGHSFGGALVPVAAMRASDVAFVITLAGYAVSGERLMTDSRRANEEARGVGAAELERIMAFQQSMFSAARSGGPWDAVEHEHRELRRREFERLADSARTRYQDFDAFVATSSDEAVLQLLKTPWGKSFLVFDAGPAIRELEIPFLAIFGEDDTSVPPAENVAPMRVALSSDPDGVIEIVPGVGHSFRESGHVSQRMLSTLVDWLADQSSR